MDKIARERIETLEGMVKVLQLELIRHVASPHYFSGHQEETIARLEARLKKKYSDWA